MDCLRDVEAMRKRRAGWRHEAVSVGLVPTMGCLHAGHMALVDAARRSCDRVVVSIFVNPTQFGPGEDFDRYPRTPDADLESCCAHGVDAVFMPDVAMMVRPDSSVYVDENRLSTGLCGASRPGHFRGVLTIVAKLFNVVEPDIAVFGQKDAQQATLIVRMVRDLDFPVRVQVEPVVREPDGLALSSRNRFLTPDERQQATALYRALTMAQARIMGGERRARAILLEMRERLATDAPDGTIDYIEAVDADSLAPLTTLSGRICMALAIRFGQTRLIDNLIMQVPRLDQAERRD